MKPGFLAHIEESIKNNWDLPALTDYKGTTYHYKDIARRIAKLHIMFEQCNLKKGDKVSIIGRNSSNWGIVFLGVLTYGAVAVPILHEFKPDNVHTIVNHSESRILFVGDVAWEGLNEEKMPNLEAIILISDFSIIYTKHPEIITVRDRLNEFFGKKYPEKFHAEHISYHQDSPEELAVINYTSGTTGFSKGVMIPYRSMLSNLLFAKDTIKIFDRGDRIVSMLPMAHMYGLAFEFIYEISMGGHIHFLTRIPSPKIILEAFAEVKPNLIVAVPLIIEKIYRKQIQPAIEKPIAKLAMKLPIVDQHIKKTINEKLREAFGGEFKEIIIGGAAFNREAEEFFKQIGFAYTVGYGMTECAPIITYDDWKTNRLYSCGKAAPRMEIKIDSPDPENIVGEILTRGSNVMLGYFKNEEATKAIIDEDGWLHTGDLAVMDKDGYVYIKGRSKNMILGSSGQNIYPEELEDRLNNMPYVAESLIVEQDGKLVALIYPDYDQLDQEGKRTGDIESLMDANRIALNEILPGYCQIARVKIYPEEFEKTPKRSIKRFMYT